MFARGRGRDGDITPVDISGVFRKASNIAAHMALPTICSPGSLYKPRRAWNSWQFFATYFFCSLFISSTFPGTFTLGVYCLFFPSFGYLCERDLPSHRAKNKEHHFGVFTIRRSVVAHFYAGLPASMDGGCFGSSLCVPPMRTK